MINIAKSDSYKYSQYLQLPPGTEYLSSYIESRGVEGHSWDRMVFFGLQYYLNTYAAKPLVTKASLDRMHKRIKQHGEPFNIEGFDYILTKYNGYAPVRIQALKEGSVVPLKTPLVQIVNTDPNCAFITDFMETNLLRIWYPCTVATQSFYIKKMIRDSLMRTTGTVDGLDFKLHDFGPRGASSSETAMIGGMAHLTSFLGTDNVEALEGADEHYSCDMAGFSVPASQHSTMTSWGGEPGEILAMENMIDKFGNGIFSVVSDSYDITKAVGDKFGGELNLKVKDLKERGGKLVVRPDSGDPTIVPVEVIDNLMRKFDFTTNSLGFDCLPSYLGVLQGDGMNENSIAKLIEELENSNLATDSLVFGMGGALLQGCNRDTLKFAMKASAACVNGEWRDVFKDPITDQGKTSKKGRQSVVRSISGEHKIVAVPEHLEETFGLVNLLEDVCINGEIKRTQTLDEIRELVKQGLDEA